MTPLDTYRNFRFLQRIKKAIDKINEICKDENWSREDQSED